MGKMRILWAVSTLGLLSLVAWAQNEAPPAQTPPGPSADPGAATRQSPPPPPSAQQRPAPRNDEFVPSEELQADEEVTFPVDI